MVAQCRGLGPVKRRQGRQDDVEWRRECSDAHERIIEVQPAFGCQCEVPAPLCREQGTSLLFAESEPPVRRSLRVEPAQHGLTRSERVYVVGVCVVDGKR